MHLSLHSVGHLLKNTFFKTKFTQSLLSPTQAEIQSMVSCAKSARNTLVVSIFKWTLNFILNVLTTFKVLMLFKHELYLKYEPWPKWEGTQ